MSFNGSGTFNINSSGQPVVTGTTISSTVFNALTADLATGLSTTITKDGQTATTVRIPFILGINSSLTTDSTNTTSGSIITAGGIGVAKAVWIGGLLNVAGIATLATGAVLNTPASMVGTNITGTAAGLTSGITNALASATTTVNVSSATAPTAGQALVATSSTAATWQTQLSRSYLAGLTLSTAGSSATMSIAAGQCADSTNAALMSLGAFSKTTSSWSLGAATGGLDTGAIANSTWYHFFVIQRPDTGVVDALISLSPTTPTMPTNYTLFRRIGSGKTNGSAQWTSFTQEGDYFQWWTPILDVNVTTAGSSAVTRTLTTPTGVNVLAVMNVNVLTTAGEGVYLSDLAVTDLAASNSAAPLETISAGASERVGAQAVVRTNTSAQIRSRCRNGSASDSLGIATLGWYDRRGRDA